MRENWVFVKKVGIHEYYYEKGCGVWYTIALNTRDGEYTTASFTTKKKAISVIDKWSEWMK